MLAAFYLRCVSEKSRLVELVNKLFVCLRLTRKMNFLVSKDEIVAVNQIYKLSYFCHFAGCGDRREFLRSD